MNITICYIYVESCCNSERQHDLTEFNHLVRKMRIVRIVRKTYSLLVPVLYVRRWIDGEKIKPIGYLENYHFQYLNHLLENSKWSPLRALGQPEAGTSMRTHNTRQVESNHTVMHDMFTTGALTMIVYRKSVPSGVLFQFVLLRTYWVPVKTPYEPLSRARTQNRPLNGVKYLYLP